MGWLVPVFIAALLLPPRLAALGISFAAIVWLRLYPRKTIDITWQDLLEALRACLLLPGGVLRRERGGDERAVLEAEIAKLWRAPPSVSRVTNNGGRKATEDRMGGTSDNDGVFVCISARTGIDLAIAKLALPKGSEVLFVPGMTIPAMADILESHGLRAVGVDPPSAAELLPESLEAYITSATRVMVVTHLFGAVYDAAALIREGQRRGLFVIEDCAQGFIGAAVGADIFAGGFRGHSEADFAIVSFGVMKTLTALGGAVGRIRDPQLREGMLALQAAYPKRASSQFFGVVLKAVAIKLIGSPYIWGLIAALVTAIGLDFDSLIVRSVRGFPNGASFQKRPSLPLLRLLLRRLRAQHMASDCNNPVVGSLARRRKVGNMAATLLAEGGVEVVGYGGHSLAQSWWLLPVLDEDPKGLVRGLWARGFDATCASTQLQPVRHKADNRATTSTAGGAVGMMQRIVYLPLTPELSMEAATQLAAAVMDVRRRRGPSTSPSTRAQLAEADNAQRFRARLGLSMLALAVALAQGPSLAVAVLPTSGLVLRIAAVAAVAFVALVAAARHLAADPKLRPDHELFAALGPPNRAEGVAYWRGQPAFDGRIDGAVLLTGSTGFVGGGILFALLARADELGVTMIVLLIRRRSGTSAEARLQQLRGNLAFDGVREVFDRLVVALEGDVAKPDFGWENGLGKWPHSEPLAAVLHCAGDVRFDQPLQQAAVSLISASLQVAQLAAAFRARRFIFVSTAFVHAVPSSNSFLQERLVELRDFDPMELYRDAVSHGKWAEKAMRELGFPNTYTFTKAIAEHLILQACAAEKVEAHIVRPSIVGPAWAAPFAGWSGDKPSTIVAAAVLLARRGLRLFRCSGHACPLVPVDMVADAVVQAMVGSGAASGERITHATIDASQASRIPSFRQLVERLLQVLTLRGDMSLPEAGLLLRFSQWADNETFFWWLQVMVNVLPNMISRSPAWRYSHLPAQYMPFSCPSSAWLFQSRLRLPQDWDPLEYTLIVHRAAVSFAENGLRPVTRESAAKAFDQLRVVAPRPFWSDAFLTFSMPRAPLHHCVAALVVRRVFQWMDLAVTVDATSLRSLAKLGAPLVLCPTHRSLLDFVIIGAACFQLRPQVPVLQLPQVAADAEFAGLPLLGRVLTALGAFFVRRGGGAVQPDPALRAEVGRVFHRGRPLEVFLEGLRSRGRRHLRLRTGLLRALRDVAQRNIALVAVALSYELLPEDHSFYDELKGLPRRPLRTLGLLTWVLRGLKGELPSYGDVHVRLGAARTLDASSDLRELLSEVQEELVSLTALSVLHARALAEVLGLPAQAVVEAIRAAGLPVRPSRIDSTTALEDAQRWPLALQAATLLRHKLPRQWALWLVEPVLSRACSGPGPGERGGIDGADDDVAALATAANGSLPEVAASDGGAQLAAAEGSGAEGKAATATLDIAAVAAALTVLLEAVEKAAEEAAQQLRDGGMAEVTEEHLAQQLLHVQDGRKGVPPPLARGAAHIVAGRLGPGLIVGYDMPAPSPSEQASRAGPLLPLWPTSLAPPQRRSDTEAVDRWGFSDTRFTAQWVDGRPAVQVTSRRYSAIGGRPLFLLWELFQKELGVPLSVRDTLPDRPLPQVPDPPEGLLEKLRAAAPTGGASSDAEARLRAGRGHGLADVWQLRTREPDRRIPDAVVRPSTEDEVLSILKAGRIDAFAVVPVGGATNVTSATACPGREVDPRPFVALDMRGLAHVLWVNVEDGLACVEAGITGVALKEALAEHGVTMGMEPDSMEFSTLGGWIATRASGMKRARYGNIEDMLVQARVATPSGVVWQRNGSSVGSEPPCTGFGRASSNVALTGLVLGSEGCLGVITSAIVRVRPLPEVVEYQSVVFSNWEQGAAWMREVARLPAVARPASCRLMDSRQLELSRAVREGSASHGPLRSALQAAVLRARGISLGSASAATLVFEGSRPEVALQKKLLGQLVAKAGGVWGGASSGEAGYALTFAIAYLRDFGLDHKVLSESLETMAPWSVIHKVWPAVTAAVVAEHQAMRLPGRPFLSCRMTQLYDEGGVLYMYLGVATGGLAQERALEAFQRLEHAARRAVLDAGGCLSHHHGVGKLRASLLQSTQSPELNAALRGLKVAMDPDNVLAARNGAWSEGVDLQQCGQ